MNAIMHNIMRGTMEERSGATQIEKFERMLMVWPRNYSKYQHLTCCLFENLKAKYMKQKINGCAWKISI